MNPHRRDWLRRVVGGIAAGGVTASGWVGTTGSYGWAGTLAPERSPLSITGLKVTPIALPDPPLLAASGCHGPYFLRNIVELRTDGGIVGIGETHGGEGVTTSLRRAEKIIVGQNAFGYRKFATELQALGMSCYAAIEMACLDAGTAPRVVDSASWWVGRCATRSSSPRIFSSGTPPIIRLS